MRQAVIGISRRAQARSDSIAARGRASSGRRSSNTGRTRSAHIAAQRAIALWIGGSGFAHFSFNDSVTAPSSQELKRRFRWNVRAAAGSTAGCRNEPLSGVGCCRCRPGVELRRSGHRGPALAGGAIGGAPSKSWCRDLAPSGFHRTYSRRPSGGRPNRSRRRHGHRRCPCSPGDVFHRRAGAQRRGSEGGLLVVGSALASSAASGTRSRSRAADDAGHSPGRVAYDAVLLAELTGAQRGSH